MANGTDMEIDATFDANEAAGVEVPLHPLAQRLANLEAADTMKVAPKDAVKELNAIIGFKLQPPYDDDDAEAVYRTQEHAIYKLAEIYVSLGQKTELKALLAEIRPLFESLPKAKTGKIVRTILDTAVAGFPNDEKLQVSMCEDSIAWANAEKHTFLRQRIEAKLSQIWYDHGRFNDAITLLNRLLMEIKKLDDKQLLVELHLTESRLHHALVNVPKAKAALTAARSISHAIYVVQKVQAQMDEMSGVLAAEEHDYNTAYSYFFEAFEAYNQMKDKENALRCLKYMLMSKIAAPPTARRGIPGLTAAQKAGSKNAGKSAAAVTIASDVHTIISSKQGLKYAGTATEAMQAVAKAAQDRSLDAFEKALRDFKEELQDDTLISAHMKRLYEQLLENNLLKIIEPFECVEIARIAELINLPINVVENKLGTMILDKRFYGILDQGQGQLIIYDYVPPDSTYSTGLQVIEEVGHVVDALYRRGEKLAL